MSTQKDAPPCRAAASRARQHKAKRHLPQVVVRGGVANLHRTRMPKIIIRKITLPKPEDAQVLGSVPENRWWNLGTEKVVAREECELSRSVEPATMGLAVLQRCQLCKVTSVKELWGFEPPAGSNGIRKGASPSPPLVKHTGTTLRSQISRTPRQRVGRKDLAKQCHQSIGIVCLIPENGK